MVPKDDLLRKLASTSLSRGRPQSWCLQCLQAFKKVGVLLAFHVLNVLVAIGGVLSAALLLVDMALMLWIHPFLAAKKLLKKRNCEPLLCTLYIGILIFLVLCTVALCVVSRTVRSGEAAVVLSIFVLLPGMIFLGTIVGITLFLLSAEAMRVLVRIDVIFVNFVTNNGHDPDECTYRFEHFDPTADNFLPHMLMTRHMWLAVVYFAVFKLVIGMLSTAVLGVTVVLPPLVIFSGDGISVFGGPIMYTVLVMTVWFVGVIGVPVVAGAVD
ncbi:hypothetical protein DVH05_010811 [Phytophthora capsici]|nr:hypothetical protein DVH05_010811 [Phytophthora capsici]